MDDNELGAVIAASIERQSAGLSVVENADAIMSYLLAPGFESKAIISTDNEVIVLDLGLGSASLGVPLKNLPVEQFSQLVQEAMRGAGTGFAFGRWGEARELYSSELFVTESTQDMESRSIHMGIDVFCKAGTPVFAPLDGRVHTKDNNAAELDYGPMLVLEHQAPTGESFYSLYGHLSLSGIEHISPGQPVLAGDRIASIGTAPENGNWPPHLHFQLILDLLGLDADFPGVAMRSQQRAWLALSPLPGMFFPECDASSLDGREYTETAANTPAQ